MQNRRCVNGYFFNNSSTAHVQLLTKMVLCTFISLQLFTVYMENSLQFEISLSVKLTKVKFAPKWVLLYLKSCESWYIMKLPYTKVKVYHKVWVHFRSHVNMVLEYDKLSLPKKIEQKEVFIFMWICT